ncbi:MAG TPA: hypothetical protein VFV37_00345, partial [Luteibaculaceae bacterium]|nr:hypothetical protein [Luteibaculaceae bacterium]
MAFGFPPNFIQEIELGDLNKDHALALAAEAATELGWQISNASESGFVAHASHSLSSWGEEITFSIDDGLALCKSESV